MVSWSDLTNDMLEHDLTGLLTLPDQHRFSAVCHSWHEVAKYKLHPPFPQLPWLVLGEDPKTKKRNFFNLSEQRHYSIDIPELYGQYICGSSHGWLITIDRRLEGHVINPFSKECYELPPFPVYHEHYKKYTTHEGIQREIVRKAILSHDPRENSDFIVMILFGYPTKLAIWRPSDKEWTVMKYPECSTLYIFYFEGLLYAVKTSSNIVYVVDLESNLLVTQITSTYWDITRNWKYITMFNGKISLVGLGNAYNDEDEVICNMEVWTLDLDPKKRTTNNLEMHTIELDPATMPTWCKLENIDGLALYVGINSTVFVDPSITDCVRNGIYFAEATYWFWKWYGHNFGVHDMVHHTFGQFCYPFYSDAFFSHDAALTWFTPSP